MQVSQQSDRITHAVLGKKESISMGMSDDAALMHILSSTLYTFPKLASIREPVCNAWDAHIEAGIIDRPLEITITADKFSVKDFGSGIPHEKIGKIYGVYGNSTKRTNEMVTGGFGLGSKAPFAYTDNFEVISCHGGLKSIYRVSKSSMEVDGKPSIDMLVQLPCGEETGITVSMTIKHVHEKLEFTKLIKEVLTLGEIKANINEEPFLEQLPLLASPTGYIVTDASPFTLVGTINVRYGNVVYPLPMHDNYRAAYNIIENTMGRLDGKTAIIFMAPPNAVSIAPNREALILTDNTLKTVEAMLKRFNPNDVHDARFSSGQIIKSAINKSIEQEKIAHVDLLFQNICQGTNIDVSKNSEVTNLIKPWTYTVKAASLSFFVRTHRGRIEASDIIEKRLQAMLDSKQYDYSFLKAIQKAYKEEINPSHKSRYRGKGQSWYVGVFHRYVTATLKTLLASNNLAWDNLHVTKQKYTWGNPELVRTSKTDMDAVNQLLPWLKKKVLIVHNKPEAHSFFERLRYQERDMGAGWVVYKVTKKEDYKLKAIEAFKSAGYEVMDVTTPALLKEGDPDNLIDTPVERKKSVKRKGYLSLASSYGSSSGYYLINLAREKCKPEDHVFDPIAYTVLNTRSDDCDRVPGFSVAESKILNELYGNQIAVVSPVQVEVMIRKGIPTASEYISTEADRQLSQRKDFPRYLAFAKQANEAKHIREELLGEMTKHESLMQSLGLRFSVSAETALLVTFFEGDFNRKNCGSADAMPLSNALAAKVKPAPQFAELSKKIKASPWLTFVDIDAVKRYLTAFAPDSERVEIPYEIVRNLLK